MENKGELKKWLKLDVEVPWNQVIIQKVPSTQKPLLGVSIESISPAIAEHLGLPSHVGLLVTEVFADSPAAKAGIKANDVLVKIDGAMVPGQPEEFQKLLASLKTDIPLDVVVLRKGKTLNLGTVTLVGESPKAVTGEVVESKAKVEARQRAAIARQRAALIFLQAQLAEKDTATTTVVRKGDTFTITHKELGTTFSVTAVVKEGKLQIGTIEVNDGKTTQTYDNLLAVPASQRARVERLVEAVSRLELGPPKE